MTLFAIVLALGWGVAAALISGLVAVALNKWVAGWSLARRVLVAAAASTAPSFGVVGFYMAELGMISLWFSPDEFLIAFGLHILLVLAVSAPVAWLVSRRGSGQSVQTDVFD